ncbi:LLM class flavin-dependent oxidoreductase [Mycoplasma zalophi]|uniref:LLM class flavin-dependent oxidoreductase n=1 Tax=Mycoplasma zalophi TaxID=191287 RepID=UPI0021CA92B4|nr:LLM class flavin-dependent oxidoreductase [Mycoplasma zalophi]MCU4117337.1 LLM class flavin-dependent oxidoreductase [Mycoplasma zalophi]
MKVELGITTFGETTIIEGKEQPISHDQRLRDMIEEMKLADEVGLDVYAIGEHHRKDFAVSAPEIVLAAGAAVTKNIKLSTAVTILSSIDPIRVYQQFATIDAISNGRAEIMVGRGSFIESFPLFGYKLENYSELFTEKLEMLKQINDNEILNWKGKFTQSVENTGIYPRVANNKKLPIWVATGGNPESTVSIASQGLPISYAIIGGSPKYFKGLVDAYRSIGRQFGFTDKQLQVSSHSWGFLGDDDQETIDKYFHPTKQLVDQISKERSHWQPLSKEQYLNSVSDDGAIFVGDAKRVTKKIISTMELLGIDRFYLHIPVGSMEHKDVMRAIEIFGKEVAPKVREYFKDKEKREPGM